MTRRLSILVAFAAAGSLGVSLSSCNEPQCGPGTVQQQQKDGTLKCVLADVPNQLTQCDTDGGNVVIVGGKCVSAVQCDPNTTMDVNGICVGTGGSGMATCHTPAPGKACVSGAIKNFKDNMNNAVTPLHVDLFEPVTLLSGGAPIATALLDTDGGSYVFQDFTPPGLGLIVVVTGRTDANMTPAATGDRGIQAGNSYRLDAYAVKKADSDAWNFDITTGGAAIAKYYHDTAPAPNLLIANETEPVPGVTMTKDGADAMAKYFDDTLTAVNPALTTTGASGVAIVASPVSGGVFPTFSGMGGNPDPGAKGWEALPGGSAPGLVFITRFHPAP